MRPSSFLQLFFAATTCASAAAFAGARDYLLPAEPTSSSTTVQKPISSPADVASSFVQSASAAKSRDPIKLTLAGGEIPSENSGVVRSAVAVPVIQSTPGERAARPRQRDRESISNEGDTFGMLQLEDYASNGMSVTPSRGGLPNNGFHITTADLPEAVVNRSYTVTLRTEGGEPPFEWTATELPVGVQIDPEKGKLFGEFAAEGSYKIAVSVQESTGLRAASSFVLDVVTTPLFISTSTLGVAKAGESFSVNLRAEGGTPPYSWESRSSLPAGLTLDSASGEVRGIVANEGSYRLQFRVRDEVQGIDTAELPFEVETASLPVDQSSEESTEPSQNVDESPTDSEEQEPEIEDEAISPPDGSEPPAVGSPVEAFIVRASDRKVGLAWKNPDETEFVETVIVRGEDDFPENSDDGTIVYSGTAENFVDTDLKNNKTYYYSAISRFADGAIGEPIQERATPKQVGLAAKIDPFIDEVVSYTPLAPAQAYGADGLPAVVLGPPSGGGEFVGSLGVVSLHAKLNTDGGASAPYGGSITVRFSDNIVANGEGPDFTIFENAFRIGGTVLYWVEPAVVDVSIDGVTYYRFPFDFVPHYDAEGKLNLFNPFVYAKGFAGIRPVFSNGSRPDPTDPERSGGDQFDLSDIKETKLSWIQYVRITSTGDDWLVDGNGDRVRHSNAAPTFGASGTGNSGFDLDAVAAIHY